LQKDLKGKLLNAPVFYPGSIERTSFAEKDEPNCINDMIQIPISISIEFIN